MSNLFGEIRKLAEAGDLHAAVQELYAVVVELDAVDTLAQAQAYELLGRCQQGLLANVQAQEAFTEAARLYGMSGDSESAVYCQLQHVRRLLDERLLPAARQDLATAWKKAKRLGWLDVLALVAEFQGLACMHVKEHAAALRLFDEALVQPDSRKLDWERLVIRLARANCLLALGQLDQGRRELQWIHEYAKAKDIPRLGKFVLMNFAYGSWLTGDYAEARQLFEQVVELCEDDAHVNRATRWLAIMAQYNLGLVDIQLENYPQAHELLLSVWEQAREHGHAQLSCASLNSLCMTSLMLHDTGSALRYAKLCFEMVQQHDDIEAFLAPYYLAVAYLADSQLDRAIAVWDAKPEMELNADSRMQFAWIARMLTKLAELTPPELTRTHGMIQDWLKCMASRQSAGDG